MSTDQGSDDRSKSETSVCRLSLKLKLLLRSLLEVRVAMVCKKKYHNQMSLYLYSHTILCKIILIIIIVIIIYMFISQYLVLSTCKSTSW